MIKNTAFGPLFLGLLVFVSGIMGYQHTHNFINFLLETFSGLVLFIFSFVMMKNKLYAYYIGSLIALILVIFYGYSFANTTQFFPGLLSALSVYILAIQIIKIFRIT